MNGASEHDEGGNLKERWIKVAHRLRVELGDDLFSSWFARMEPEGRVETTMVVSVPTRFLRNWIQSHYVERLLKLCNEELGAVDRVDIRVRPRGKPKASMLAPNTIAARVVDTGTVLPRRNGNGASRPVTAAQKSAGTEARTQCAPLDHGLTFDTFVVGKSNMLAHAACVRASETEINAPVGFNPLYIHSAAGLGKSHLLNAVSWYIRNTRPDRKVLYVTAERFMYQFKAALDAKDTLAFKDHFQSADVLMIDDFQFLQGNYMQQEFCHTFNSLVDSKRQVIIAADLPPAQLDNIDARTRSRLAGGLVVEIEPPELELRREILKARVGDLTARDTSIAIPDEVIEFMANRISGGGRELEGALTRVIATRQLTKSAITIDTAAVAIRDLVNPVHTQRVKIDDILRIIGKHFNVPKADLLSPRRARSIVRPRQIGMYLAKTLTTRSLPEIGRRFGGRDHSTVLHAVRKIESLMQEDDKLAREVALLVRLLEQP
ncbi:MAG: chromosomal replication initiator protein DnaA [Hyphomicrobiales bacterium]